MPQSTRFRASEVISREIQTFKGKIKITDVAGFDHYDTVDKINNYKNDTFHKNTEEGAIFWNLAKPRIPHFVKKFKLKPRNFRMYAKGNNSFFASWIINQKFQYWARESGFAIDLEDLKVNASEYGTAIMKLVDEGSVDTIYDEEVDKYNFKPCYLSRLYYDTAVEWIINSNIIEVHHMTEFDLRQKMSVWDLKEEDIEHIKKYATKVTGTEADMVITKYIIFERHGEYKEDKDGWYDEKEKPVYMRHVLCGEGDNEKILFKEKMERKDCPYYDFPIGGYDGHHLREGVYARLFDLQKRVNQLVNENKQASTIASLLLFKSEEEDLYGKNLIQQAISGQVLNTRDLEQVGIDNRYLQGFLNELLLIEKQADALCMTPDVASTKDPENSPVRTRILNINEINSAFDTIRDRIALKLVKIMLDKIMPAQVAEWNKEDLIEISSNFQDIKIYDFYVLNYKLRQYIKKAFKEGRNPTEEEKAQFLEKESYRMNVEGRQLKGMKGFFNFDYGFYMNPTNSDMDRGQQNEIIDWAMELFMANPAIVNHPLYQYKLEMNNIPPFMMSMGEAQQYGQQQQGQPAQTPQKDKLLDQVNE